jgi:ribosomal protein S18 acetylase RimI-like enzyme
MNHPDKLIHDHLGIWWKATPSLADKAIGTFSAPRSLKDIRIAEEALRQQGCTHAVAPMEGTTWKRHRAVIESDGSPPFLLEPLTPPATAELLQHSGYQILARYSSSTVDLIREQPDLGNLKSRLGEVSIRPLNLLDLEGELRAIYRLSTRAFLDNFLYHPICESDFLTQYLSLTSHLTPECAYLAHRDGGLVGYVFGYPSDDRFVVKTLAVLPERRLAGLGTLLVDHMQKAAQAAGFETAIHALQRDDNPSLRISRRFRGKIFRRYALFSKEL